MNFIVNNRALNVLVLWKLEANHRCNLWYLQFISLLKCSSSDTSCISFFSDRGRKWEVLLGQRAPARGYGRRIVRDGFPASHRQGKREKKHIFSSYPETERTIFPGKLATLFKRFIFQPVNCNHLPFPGVSGPLFFLSVLMHLNSTWNSNHTTNKNILKKRLSFHSLLQKYDIFLLFFCRWLNSTAQPPSSCSVAPTASPTIGWAVSTSPSRVTESASNTSKSSISQRSFLGAGATRWDKNVLDF